MTYLREFQVTKLLRIMREEQRIVTVNWEDRTITVFAHHDIVVNQDGTVTSKQEIVYQIKGE